MVEAVTASTTDSSSLEEPPILLHGYLDLWILETCNLSKMDIISEHLHRFFIACRPPSPSSCPRPRWPPHHHYHHPYVTISVASAIIASTRIIPNSQDPKWNEHFKILLTHRFPFNVFHVKDNDIFGTKLIDTISNPTALVASSNLIRDWYPILGPFRKPPKLEISLLVPLQYKPIDENPIYIHGIAGDLKKLGIRDTYFLVQKGSSVMLYQDTHIMEGELPEIELENGMNFEHNGC